MQMLAAGNAVACRAGGMIGWPAIGHEAKATPPRNGIHFPGSSAAGIRLPRAEVVEAVAAPLTASSPEHWLTGSCGVLLRGIDASHELRLAEGANRWARNGGNGRLGNRPAALRWLV